MFADSRQSSNEKALRADVCVVGGGAAGIALAVELADSPLQVVVLEGGGLTPDPTDEGGYQILSDRGFRLGNDPLLPWYFGGNTNHWRGNCRPLEEPDFHGWPFTRQELIPYYERAQRTLGLPEFAWYDLDRCRPLLGHPPLEVDPTVLVTRVVQTTPVRGVAELHCRRIQEASNVQVVLHAPVLRLQVDAGGERVSAAEVAVPGGRRLRVEADTFVLATGGVENARLLLCSNDRNPAGIGNDHDLVGRSFMDHMHVDVPLAGWKTDLDLGLYYSDTAGPQTIDGAGIWAQLELAPELRRNGAPLGLGVWFLRAPRSSLSVGATRRFGASLLGLRPLDPVRDVRLILTDPLEVPRHAGRTLTRRIRATEDGYVLRVQIEQPPDPGNRIFLSAERDGVGRARPQLVLRLPDGELERYAPGLDAVAGRLGLSGERVFRQLQLILEGGRCGFFWHHTGSTRMDRDPEAGVVDADCRVHGVSNLFVAGSSVFPTSGWPRQH